MANCSSIFKKFDSTIRLSKTKRESLIGSRDALRTKIRDWFKEKKSGEIQPKFSGQGSFFMGTAINPIKRKDSEGNDSYPYDLDDGIYFVGEDGPEDRVNPTTYHSWVLEAVKGHTAKQTDKNTCVRVLYSDGHNLDFPIYYKKDEEKPELAHKANGWSSSDPKEMIDWFKGKADGKPQIRRIVRYLKGWSDFKKVERTDKKMPSGLVFTVLATEHYCSHDRDDVAFYNTLLAIQSKLESNFECICPACPQDEILASKYNDKAYFLECLKALISDAKLAIESLKYNQASEYWRKHFGDRFRLGEDKEDPEIKLLGLASNIISIITGTAFTDNHGRITTDNSQTKNQPHKFYGGDVSFLNKNKYDYSILHRQKYWIERRYHYLKCQIKDDILICVGEVQPNQYCANYRIQLKYKVGTAPKARIIKPHIKPNKLIHMYDDGSLCLFYPPELKWDDNSMDISQTLVPWISEWIVFYETWLITGYWLGYEQAHD